MKLKRFNESKGEKEWEIIDYDNDSGKILSVKRLSDGEVFSIGDEVGHDVPGAEYMKMGKIDRIWKSFDQMRIDIGKLGIVLNDYVKKLDNVQESAGTNPQLLRQMIQLSNNSRLTQEAAVILSENLSDEQLNRIFQWLFLANRN